MRVYISELIVIRDGEISTRVRSCISDLLFRQEGTPEASSLSGRPVRADEGHCAQVMLVD